MFEVSTVVQNKECHKMKIQKDKHVVLSIQETKWSSEIATKLMSLIYKDGLTIAIDAKGASGGISIS